MRKVFFSKMASKWRPRWPPFHKMDYNSGIIDSKDMILMSIHRFLRSTNPLRLVKMRLKIQVCQKPSNMASKASKMAAVS